MAEFPVHTHETGPQDSRASMKAAEEAFGFTPNLIGVMAEAPAAARAYLQLGEALEDTSLSPVEQQVVLLAVSFENGCEYCMAAHSGGARAAGAGEDTVGALRQGDALADPRLEALRRFTRTVVRERGWVGDDEIDRFLDAGFGRAQVLEVLVGVAMKTLSNYTNHIAGTPLDDALADFRWTAPSQTPAGAAAD